MTEPDSVRLVRLELEQFRVYTDLGLDIPSSGLRLVGPNGSGKTTLLEAVELLSTTRPRQGATDGDLIAHKSGFELGVAPYSRVVGSAFRGDIDVRVEVFVERSERRSSTRKLFRVADRPRRAGDVVGLVPTVRFSPDDLDLVLGPPSGRRRFLDILLSQVDRRYLRHLSRYAKILAQRNGLLRQLAGAAGSERRGDDQLAYWDEQLVALGSYIVAARLAAMSQMRQFAGDAFSTLSGSVGQLDVAYGASVELPESLHEAATDADILNLSQAVGALFEQQVRQGRQQDLARGSTLIGPHRDDLVMSLGDRPLARFGSRGQQRLAVLAAKLAELRYARVMLDVQPILLLDDILSELDPDNRYRLLESVSRGGQLFVSATERSLVENDHLDHLPLLRIEAPGEVVVDAFSS